MVVVCKNPIVPIPEAHLLKLNQEPGIEDILADVLSKILGIIVDKQEAEYKKSQSNQLRIKSSCWYLPIYFNHDVDSTSAFVVSFGSYIWIIYFVLVKINNIKFSAQMYF